MEGSTLPITKVNERRRHARLKSNYDVDVVLLSGSMAGDAITGKAINVSKEGAGLVFKAEILIGTQVGMTLYGDEDQSTCLGDIIWKKDIEGRMVHGLRIVQWSHLDPTIEQKL